MKKIFMLSLANIRKTKGHTVSILLMFIIASLLLNAGLLVSLNFGSFFEKITNELNTSDAYYLISDQIYTKEVDNYLNTTDNVTKMQKESSIWAQANIPYNDTNRDIYFLMNDMSNSREISKWKFVGEHLPADTMSIYIPYVMGLDGGYKLNEKLILTLKDTKLTFTIKGFVEDAYFSSLDTGMIGSYLPHETFEKVKSMLGGEYNATLVYANLKEQNKEVETAIRDIVNNDTNSSLNANITSSMFSIDKALIRLSRTMMASIIAVMMVAFAAIIAAVCLIVVRFRIGNSIEEDMLKIGSLKAVGYTSRQIITTIVLQFSIIAFLGSAVGIVLSYLTTPTLSDVFAHQSGLMWTQGFDRAISFSVLISLLFVVVLVSFIAARRINKLSPIVALRSGIITHNFRKNHMPLDKSKGSLPINLAFKSTFQNLKQSFMITVIFIAVAFASSFSVGMYYNTSVDTKAFAETPGIELSNAIAVLNPNVDNANLVKNIDDMKDVRKAQYLDEAPVRIDNNNVFTYVMDDYSAKETDTIYKGRYPIHSNEIAIAGQLSGMLNKNIGDSVTLKVGDKQAEYIITGLTQGSSMGGNNTSVRRDGIMRINPAFKQQTLQIYLNKGTKSEEFLNTLNTQFKDSFLTTVDVDKSMAQGMGVYVDIVSKVGITMLFFTILVVILVLYFVINSSVIRRKRELGIQKAIGFTTLQLMNQVSVGFLPPVVVGVVLGCLIGITQINVIMTAAQRPMGIMRAHFIVTPSWIALFGVAIVLISYLTSMLITYKIRKISAYSLVSE